MASQIVSEEIVRLAVEACPTGMIVTDSSGEIVLLNTEIERLFGYRREELIGKSIDILLPAAMRTAHAGHRASFIEHPQARRMGIGRDLYGLRKDGSQVPIEIGLNPNSGAGGLMIVSAVTDITERKQAEAALLKYAEREQLYVAVVESSYDAIITKTLDGVITSWNPAAERLFGFTAQEAISQSIDIIVPAELRDELRVILDKIHKGEKVDHYETVRVDKTGRRINVSLSISPVKSPAGEVVGTAKVARDITAQKQVQQVLAKRSEELQRSNADLEQFAYVASHDLQEPLRMVATYTQLLGEYYKDRHDEKAEKYIHHAVDGAKRMQQLVKDLLTYSRVDSQGRQPALIHCEVIVKNVLENLKMAIEENHAEIVCDELPVVRADIVQLTQLFQNLIGNALKFHGERPPQIHIHARQNKDKWVFRVDDNGIGIEKQYTDVVFQMFSRLHERGRYEGNGIGLAISKKIVERHGGQIWFDSELKKGSTFYFTMPATQGNIPW